MAQFGAVSAGQRYIKTYHFTHDRTVWEVVDVKVVGTAPPHAQLVNCRDPFDIRTVSCAELTEGGAFDLAEEAADPPHHMPRHILEPVGGLVAGSARLGRLLRQITLAVRRFKRVRPGAPAKIKSVDSDARKARRVI